PPHAPPDAPFHRVRAGSADAEPAGPVVVDVGPGRGGRRAVAGAVRRPAHRRSPAVHGDRAAGGVLAVAGASAVGRARHRSVVPRSVDAVRAAGSLHAAVHRGIRHAPEPPVFHLPAPPEGSRLDAVAGLQGRAAGRPGGVAGGRVAGGQAVPGAGARSVPGVVEAAAGVAGDPGAGGAGRASVRLSHVPDEGAVLRAVRRGLQPAGGRCRPAVVRPCGLLRRGGLRHRHRHEAAGRHARTGPAGRGADRRPAGAGVRRHRHPAPGHL
ncbi:hypothetical protein OY671_008551, partial [Metschnikowia pulcherrima]